MLAWGLKTRRVSNPEQYFPFLSRNRTSEVGETRRLSGNGGGKSSTSAWRRASGAVRKARSRTRKSTRAASDVRLAPDSERGAGGVVCVFQRSLASCIANGAHRGE